MSTSASIVLKSFQELGSVLNLDELPAGPACDPETGTPVPSERVSAPREGIVDVSPVASTTEDSVDLQTLLARLAAAEETLALVRRQDEEACDRARRDLQRYEELVAEARSAEAALDRTSQVRANAEALLASAFGEQARSAAQEIVQLASRGESAAAALLAERRQEAAMLEAQPAVQRVLGERQRQEALEAAQREAAELERARRLSDGIAQALEALGRCQVEEAEALLGHLCTEYPDSAEVASLLHKIAHERWLVKAQAAEQALREARKAHRHDPQRAIALIEPLDVNGLPDALARQLFGLWARCHALLHKTGALIEPLRYAPDPGRGLILARERADGAYVVSSALGMGNAWHTGQVVPERLVRRARPLH